MFLPLLGTDTGLVTLPSVTLLARRRSPLAFPAVCAEVSFVPSLVCGLDLVGSDENSFADRPQQLAFQFPPGRWASIPAATYANTSHTYCNLHSARLCAYAQRRRPTMDLTAAQRDRACGVLLGAAAGDALGAGYEFGPPLAPDAPVDMIGGGLGPFKPGEWTDDTSMAIAIAEIAATGAATASSSRRT